MKNILYFFVLITIISCNKDEDDAQIKFSGITKVNAVGQTIEKDPNDWRFDDNWGEIEKNLFNTNIETVCDFGNQLSITAYPNPSSDIIFFHFSGPIEDNNWGQVDKEWSFRIVDQDFNILIKRDGIPTDHIELNLSSFDLKGQEIIRCYYKVHGEECETRGHGDILIRK